MSFPILSKMSASVKILTLLAFCVVASEALHKISVRVNNGYTTTSHYDEEALNERRRENARLMKKAGVSQLAIDALDGFGRRFQDLYKQNPTLTEVEYFEKFGESYFGQLFELVGYFPSGDRLRIGRVFGDNLNRARAGKPSSAGTKPARP
ncbi:unnamed protein product [Caenorhabditis auriculariae]|uniref:Uncharacterized protein n=1 Tax=Caenorhabditis auriculariae TaxID=2777116 RepID=A0A8S1HJ31_9PELO|nr:unnamed protein product [Caenorhabditis auriculariae]